ncbi:chromosomal replication initiator protein DnaA [Methylocystis bryophila]|uniref:Chromosomal replication initiator protein DnaA n=1 Tax=Methylocystis bryophila TaxID=655015 RepID=A0A1W6MY72_9HYPH|nr:chromosomal replication initiator protein DnaA [Methylocystis bryophila]ARN82531.1 chromosomal replication initiation protein DnaA [Methylocystis bryophila]BDV38732.1 chromosomal replication initiator protein DnaA [Methylocystis bryophila]
MSDDDHLPAGSLSSEYRQEWERARERMRIEVGDQKYETWFSALELLRREGSLLYLTMPTKFLRNWMNQHYLELIRARIAAEFKGVDKVIIEVRTPNPKTKAAQAAAPGLRSAAPSFKPMPSLALATAGEAVGETALAYQRRVCSPKIGTRTEADGFVGSPLDRRLTFATFKVGKSNDFAFAAARRAAEQCAQGAAPLFNPLYVHASVGLGKTHLLQAMARQVGDGRRRVLYLTAERFMSNFGNALRDQTAYALKEDLRSIDMLVVDDLQFLQGKTLRAEFSHLVNALIDSGRQIVVAADRPPAQLESLDERASSRFKGGLCVEIGPLDEELRQQVLETRIAAAKEQHDAFVVPRDVVVYVAKIITSNGRDLDGAVSRLLAHSSLNGAPICVSTAEQAIRDLVNTHEPKRVKIDDIQKLVASHYNVSRADIVSSRRTANVVLPRQVAMYLSKALTPRSLPEIGRRFGGRDHTTVIHAVRKIENLIAKDNGLAQVVELLKRMLNEQ